MSLRKEKLTDHYQEEAHADQTIDQIEAIDGRTGCR